MAGVKEKDISARTDRDTIYAQTEQQKNQLQHEERMQELALRKEIALLEYATQERISLNDAKAQLAQTAMKLNVQQDLSTQPHGGGPAQAPPTTARAITPPTEPVGRAAPGHAFEQ
jgi:hypothetical protein